MFGVIAGLRAATHETCVVLPVDCPLVTPELLRELAGARAIPQTGPLPGVYAKAMLPELESRVARGELSLRGVNPTVLEVDEKLLLNVNTRMDLLAAAIADWAHEREDVRAVLVVGSQARTDTPADRWSDLDAVLFVDEPAPTRRRRELGRVSSARPFSPSSSRPRSASRSSAASSTSTVRTSTSRWWTPPSGATCLPTATRRARSRISRSLRRARPRGRAAKRSSCPLDQLLPTPLRSASSRATSGTTRSGPRRSSARGEVFTAIECLDGYLKERLVTLLEWHARAVDPSVDTWHDGRYLERWADPGALVGARARVRALRPPRRRPRALGDDRPLPGPRGGDGAAARARGRARPRRPETPRRRGRPRSAARGYALTVKRALLLVAGCAAPRRMCRRRQLGRGDRRTRSRCRRPARLVCTGCATGRSGPCSREVAGVGRRGDAVMAELVDGPSRRRRGARAHDRDSRGRRRPRSSVDGRGCDRRARRGAVDRGARAVVYTLTQFPTVESVEIDGQSYTRADFEEQTPSVLVESPLPFEEVTSPLRADGTANTFEANFQYELTRRRRQRRRRELRHRHLGHGHARHVRVHDRRRSTSVATLVVFESSAEDGSRMNEVEIPLTVAP